MITETKNLTDEAIEKRTKFESNLEMEFCIMNLLVERLLDINSNSSGAVETAKIAICEEWKRFAEILKEVAPVY